MQPLLSICIPTYNRCRYLPETLDSILAQSTPEVEIVISDNASTDETRSVLTEYAAKHSNILYSCASTNQGPDANFIRVVSLAKGTYCWLLSDDDTVKPGAIATLLQEIKEGYDIYTFNETTCGNRLEPIKDQQRLAVPEGKVVYELSKPSDLRLFFERSDPVGGIPFGLISVLVFKKKIWDSIQIPDTIMETAYVHVYVLLATKAQGAKLKYINQALIMNRLNDSYISTNPIRNFWITADGYLLLADTLFKSKTQEHEKQSFLSISRNIYKIRNIITLRIFSETPEEWLRIELRLVELGYNNIIIKTIGASKLILTTLRYIWRKLKSLQREI